MATGGNGGKRQMPSLNKYECATEVIESLQVRMPDGSTKVIYLPVLPSSSAETPREKRLGVLDETVREVKQRLLRENNYPEASLQDYEMLWRGPHGSSEVMQDYRHIGTYRADLGVSRDVSLEIRLRPLPPEAIGCQLK